MAALYVRPDRADHVRVSAPPQRMRRAWPLAGRTEELGTAVAALRGRSGVRGVVLVGQPGVGKTRLAREALGGLADAGVATRWVAATESARAVPLGSFAPLVRTLDPDVGGVTALRAAAAELLRDAPPTGLVIGVDDAHLLDNMSAMLVHHLAADRAVPMIMTVRAGEPVPDAVTALWKDGPLLRLDLHALPSAEMAGLLAAVLGGPVEGDTAERMWNVTAGNVLYLRHLVDGELEAERLRQVAGVWRWRGDLALPPPLRELIDARLGRLPDAVHSVMELVALGEPLDAGLLSRLTDPDALDVAERRRLVTVADTGRRLEVRLGHPLHGEAVREGLSLLRARRLRGVLATALAESEPAELLRRAVLAIDSDLPPDAELFRAAAVEANRLGALALAERLAAASSAAARSFDSELMLGYAHAWQGRPAEGAARLAAAAALAATPEQEVRGAVAEVSNLWWGLGDAAGARKVLSAALAVPRPAHLHAELEAVDATLRLLGGDPTGGAEQARSLLTAPAAGSRTITWAGYALTLGAAVAGRCDEALATVEQAHAAALRAPETAFLRTAIWEGHLLALRLAGRLAEATAVADGYAADAAPSAMMRWKAEVYRAAVEIDKGAVGAGIAALRGGIASFSGTDPANWTLQCQVQLACALGMAGDGPGAAAALAAASALSRPTTAFGNGDLMLAAAWVAAADGVVTEAIGRAREAAAEAGPERPALAAAALHTAVCFGDRTLAEPLRELAARMATPRAEAAAAHAKALADGDGAGLEAASIQLAATGALLLAADAAAQAGAAYRRAGRKGLAAVASARAEQLALRCPGASTPALRAAAMPLPITDREREIATLVAAGLSNHAIADRLVVSVRTVEGHIYRACAKLDVTDRTALGLLVSST